MVQFKHRDPEWLEQQRQKRRSRLIEADPAVEKLKREKEILLLRKEIAQLKKEVCEVEEDEQD